MLGIRIRTSPMLEHVFYTSSPSLVVLLCHRYIRRKLCDTAPCFDIAGLKHMWKEARNRAVSFLFLGLGHT